jgi:ribosomal-protein-alanine N-acetyltransferase
MVREDIKYIVEIEKLSFSTPWSSAAFLSELQHPEQTVYFVARVRGQVVGYVGMWIIMDEGHITNIAIHPNYRGKGIGTRLLSFLFAVSRQRGIGSQTLEVRRTNIRAQKLYRRMGFVASGVRPGYYRDNNEDAIIMWRRMELE